MSVSRPIASPRLASSRPPIENFLLDANAAEMKVVTPTGMFLVVDAVKRLYRLLGDAGSLDEAAKVALRYNHTAFTDMHKSYTAAHNEVALRLKKLQLNSVLDGLRERLPVPPLTEPSEYYKSLRKVWAPKKIEAMADRLTAAMQQCEDGHSPSPEKGATLKDSSVQKEGCYRIGSKRPRLLDSP